MNFNRESTLITFQRKGLYRYTKMSTNMSTRKIKNNRNRKKGEKDKRRRAEKNNLLELG